VTADSPEEIQAALERGAAAGPRVVRLVLLGFVGLMACSMCGGVLYAVGKGVFGKATIFVFHEGSESVEVWVDGALDTHITAPGITEVRLDRGDHRLELRGSQEQAWELPGMNGLDDYLVPTDPQTCFAVIDVTFALYEAGAPDGDLCQEDMRSADIIDTYRTFPREVGRPTFEVEDLPDRISSGTAVFLTLPLPCDAPDEPAGEELLRAHLGCSPDPG